MEKKKKIKITGEVTFGIESYHDYRCLLCFSFPDLKILIYVVLEFHMYSMYSKRKPNKIIDRYGRNETNADKKNKRRKINGIFKILNLQ